MLLLGIFYYEVKVKKRLLHTKYQVKSEFLPGIKYDYCRKDLNISFTNVREVL